MACSNILTNISRTKYLDSTDLKTDFKRCLTTTDLTIIGMANMVGSGLYVLTGEVAKNLAGPAVIISYIIAGLVSLMAAICYAEFGGRVPKTGSAFLYAYVTMGEIWAFIIGWNLVLEYMVASAAVASALSGSFDHLIGNQIENVTIEVFLNGKPWESTIFASYPDLVAFSIICILIVVVSFGVSCSSNVMNCFVVLNVFIVFTMFIISLTKADFSNFNAGNGFFAYGFPGVIAGSATCFFAFVGFDIIALATEEALTPSKSTPIASVVSVISVICLYVIGSITLILLVPYYNIMPKSAFPSAFESVGYKWAEYVIGIGTLVGMASTLVGSLFALPRSVYAMAIEGLLFPCFASVNKRTHVPVISTVIFGLVSALLALFLDLSALVEFLSIGTLLAYAMVATAVIFVRYEPNKNPNIDESLSNEPPSSSIHQSLFIPAASEIYGTLKEPFKDYPIISRFSPGEAVRVFYVISVIFQFLSMVIVFQVPEFFSKWWALLLSIIFGLLAILAFIPIPMHYQNKDIATFKTPLVPYFPAISVFFNVMLMVKLKPLTWIRLIVWIIIGCIIYAFYGYHHSEEGKKRTTNGKTKDYQKMTTDQQMKYGSFELEEQNVGKLD